MQDAPADVFTGLFHFHRISETPERETYIVQHWLRLAAESAVPPKLERPA